MPVHTVHQRHKERAVSMYIRVYVCTQSTYRGAPFWVQLGMDVSCVYEVYTAVVCPCEVSCSQSEVLRMYVFSCTVILVI